MKQIAVIIVARDLRVYRRLVLQWCRGRSKLTLHILGLPSTCAI